MQTQHVPRTGPRYWTAISIASVFGANCGDFLSHNLHLGHTRGLLPLALTLSLVVLMERRTRAPTEAFYWLAIVILRTAATNLADLLTHDLKLGYGWVVASLAALLLVVLLPFRPREQAPSIPPTGVAYWIAMLIAGTLGTAIGDALADDVGLGVPLASVVLTILLAAAWVVRARPKLATWWSYWLAIVAVRSTGTTVGDWLAHGLGLASSTLAMGVLFALVLVLWRAPARRLVGQT